MYSSCAVGLWLLGSEFGYGVLGFGVLSCVATSSSEVVLNWDGQIPGIWVMNGFRLLMVVEVVEASVHGCVATSKRAVFSGVGAILVSGCLGLVDLVAIFFLFLFKIK